MTATLNRSLTIEDPDGDEFTIEEDEGSIYLAARGTLVKLDENDATAIMEELNHLFKLGWNQPVRIVAGDLNADSIHAQPITPASTFQSHRSGSAVEFP